MSQPIRAAILVDENNAMHQLHALGVEGIQPWGSFFRALELVLQHDYADKAEVSRHFYGAIVPRKLDYQRHLMRKRFFDALQRDGIHVHKGYCEMRSFGLAEKGVDVLLALDVFEMAHEGYDLLIVFSGDADLAPAIERARAKGTKVVAVLAEQQKAKVVKNAVDGVVSLESILALIPPAHIVPTQQAQTPIYQAN